MLGRSPWTSVREKILEKTGMRSYKCVQKILAIFDTYERISGEEGETIHCLFQPIMEQMSAPQIISCDRYTFRPNEEYKHDRIENKHQ